MVQPPMDQNVTIYGWHFHIYMVPNDQKAYDRAHQWYEVAKAKWGKYMVREGSINIFDKPVGPHTLPMLQICLEDPNDADKNGKLLPEVLAWVQLNVDLMKFPTLIHPLTTPFSDEEELKDHTIRAFWAGNRQLLNTERL
eukprot:CAMPEP_0117430778 /NCGR_PEP_ID=MMETSP0758-20121206/10325_1 /TAXON_ID=63605 /ORGANISM="Percolomonas cosmopolitus, Strain AE-1 (ATCC 50343)" /LENGTH=139 /DNA_ID=CAMNT_0005219153 /DNA_START=60 /DNA_END=479 /DNA_ORIENTATION=+